ncbi:MAG: glycosyltransferase [Betaproteobacteria bacterium]|nr:glycosyltransferase [Betaproteobacteria bacterium]
MRVARADRARPGCGARAGRAGHGPEGRPSISVVVPTFGRPQELRGCLEALAALDYPRDRYEVVVVDDGSDPPVVPWAGAADPGCASAGCARNAGPAARNAGARAATGEILAFTDDDCRPASDWLSAIAAALARDPEALCGGTTTNALEHSACSVASHAIVDVAIEHLHAGGDDLRFFPSNNLALRADAFASIGGFDEAFRTAEDRDLCDRWLREGRPLVRAPLAKVAPAVLSPRLWRQPGYGRGACRLHRERFRRAHRGSFRTSATTRRSFVAPLPPGGPASRSARWRSCACGSSRTSPGSCGRAPSAGTGTHHRALEA